MNRLRFSAHIARRQHAVDRPRKVHRGRTRIAHAPRGDGERLVVFDGVTQHRNAVRAEDSDRGRAAHRERFDRVFDLLDRAGALTLERVRNQTLVNVR